MNAERISLRFCGYLFVPCFDVFGILITQKFTIVFTVLGISSLILIFIYGHPTCPFCGEKVWLLGRFLSTCPHCDAILENKDSSD